MAPRRSTRKKAAPPAAAAAPKKRAPAAAPVTPTKKKQKLTGLKTSVDDSDRPLGVIDPESKITNGTIEALDGAPCDVMLALIDPAKNMDKFYILQLIACSGNWIVYTRWGRTGTAGQALQQEFDDKEDAIKCFQDKFHQKTGRTWQDRQEPLVGGKYRFVPQDYAQKQQGFSQFKWQYWVDDFVNGKPTGWYDYDAAASAQVERLYLEYSQTPALAQRWVDSGVWTYHVNLQQMIQTNVTHENHTSRRIRRCPNEEPATTVPPTPTKTSSASVPVPIVTPSKPSKTTHPVDPEIAIQGQNPTDYHVVQGDDGNWYDVVLNQCNINSNNNKYYRLQMLRYSDQSLYCWFRWGRVGEGANKSATTWSGPFATIEAAHKVFAKKYRDKTGNAFGADSFVEKKGKYVPVEIDNDVEVDEAFVKTEENEDIEYLPSALDPKTKELIEVLFSEEMRNEALSSFSIDLKKLPLGVPSQQQIQRGIDILSDIEHKLQDVTSTAESFEELSSRFFTAIPHSFGRSRPPVISTQDALQSRYDMCNILLDMYTTNDTIRRIEKERQTSTKKTLPHPVDAHYLSLKATLAPLPKQNQEYSLIQEYFNKTKDSSSAKLLDVWSVDRENESRRFAKFSKLGNRSLLWHGTNIAVVAPILTSGLRIMPHSGGRVGAGIYLANLQQKSAQYTCSYGSKFACMFLCEAPLGKQHTVTEDGHHASSLRQAPAGFDSVHAVGTWTPKQWATMKLDGLDVSVPQEMSVESGVESTFSHDELLVYDEAQVRIRYVVTVKL